MKVSKMKIGYWLGNIGIKSGGSGPYAWRILEVLLENSQAHKIDIIILCSANAEANCLKLIDKYQARAKIFLIPPWIILLSRVLLRTKLTLLGKFLSQMPIKLNVIIGVIQNFKPWLPWFRSLELDLLHVPVQTPPYYDLPYPFVVTMHDVQELHYPNFFTPQVRIWRAKYYRKALEASRAIVVSFNHIKQDLIKFFGISDDKVHICPPPYQKICLSHPSCEEELIYQKKYDHLNTFLLYPAQTWEHKNHLSLIKAIELIKNRYCRIINIICTGRKYPIFFPTIEDYLKKSEVANQVDFLGMIPESELSWLYKNCSLVVIPTLYEAGSFPLLEAMSLGSPVICSNVTSLPETIDDARFVFDPLNIEQMADLILKLLDDDELRTANVKQGKLQTEKLGMVESFPSILQMWKNILSL